MNQRYYSNVYWHFTGSPTRLDGFLLTKPADIHHVAQPKDTDEATDVLIRILRSRTLLATSVEKIAENLQTDPFCCVTDIPLKDLPLHAVNYGQVALGFKAPAIHNRFVPVLYLSKDNEEMREKLFNHDQLSRLAESGKGYQFHRVAGIGGSLATQSDPLITQNPFLNFIKMTDYSVEPEETFYSEREWRHIGDFAFSTDDIEAVIAPACVLPELRRCIFDELGYPDALSLFAWEFLEKA